jgi:dTDP-4-amino-4,6-dideoxygalactose transaminase
MDIPLGKPFIEAGERDSVIDVLASRNIASSGVTREFENALARKFERKYCVAVNSGTSALYLALKIMGINKVIIPSVTCIQVLNAALNAGSIPVFADVDAETHNIELSALTARQLSEADGMIVTHAYGHAADMSVLEQYARRYNIKIVEDFAQSMGGYFNNKIIGSFGHVAVTSFYSTKNMTTGYGGAIFTDDAEFYRRCLYARGDISSNRYKYDDLIPMNLKISDILSAIGLVQLRKLDIMVNLRRSAAGRLTTLLASPQLKLPIEKPGVKHTFYKYALGLPENVNKAVFIDEMKRQGISVGVLYDPPLHKVWLDKIASNNRTSLPVSELVASRTVSIPLFPELSDSDIARICQAVHIVLKDLEQKGIS